MIGWVAFALAVALFAAYVWRVRHAYILPGRQLEALVRAIDAGEEPATFVVGESGRMREIGFALGEIARRQKELRARVQEGEFGVQAIMGAMTNGLVVTDEKRRVRLMNRAFREMFEVDSQTNDASLFEIVREAAVDRLLGETLRDGEIKRAALSRPNDQHFEIVAAPIKEESGAIRGAAIFFRDVTELRRTETMRRDFVANVSHELRTPLSILRGYLETLLENPKQPPSELLRIFEVMERHSNRLNLLVDDVLSLARLEGAGVELDLSTITAATFLRGIMRDWEKKFAARNLVAEFDAPNELPTFRADEGRVQEVLYNLIDNAVKYSDPGGRIIVRAWRDGERIGFGVSDTGVGISGRDLPRIFERFYRTDQSRQRERGGTGLGLSIVKHIAQLHGGRVEAESTPGRGTTLRVYFPLAPVTKK